MITGVILAHNEEKNIVPCIEALRPYVQELLLIDTESSDRTRPVAEPLVDRVLSHPNIPNFDAIRNIAIPEATHEWMWFVDADERIPFQTGVLVNQLVRERGQEFEAIVVPFKSYFCHQWMQHCGWWPGYTMPRVLKRGHFRFAERLHGGVECSGRQIRLGPDPNIAIDHFSYESIEHYLQKVNRYTSTEALQLLQQGTHYDWKVAIRHMVHDVWAYYERNEGKHDGGYGWILSWLSGQYRWLSHAKLFELGNSKLTVDHRDLAPESLDSVLNELAESLNEFRASSPTLPLGIVWRGPVWDPSGYADESRAFAKALARSDREIAVEEIRWSDAVCELPSSDKSLLRLLTHVRKPKFTATITNCIPTLADISKTTSLNILRTTFETDRIPDSWHPHLEQYDEVWVISHHNYRAFVRSWVPPEKLRTVPSCIDTELFSARGKKLEIPKCLTGRFIFLSVLDWNLRKGWDVLLTAFAKAFSLDDGVGLLVKITRNHGHSWQAVRAQVNAALSVCGQSLESRPDIVLWDCTLSATEMAALYRSVDAFVLASRGEGWGRPYMEAMACGRPTIGSRWSGNLDFMDDDCAFLVDGREVEVPELAWREVPPYRGQRWFEPDSDHLAKTMRLVFEGKTARERRAKKGCEKVRQSFDLHQGRCRIEEALSAAEQRFIAVDAPVAKLGQTRVRLEGELFARHSFSKINEHIIRLLGQAENVGLSVNRLEFNPTYDETSARARELLPYVGRDLGGVPNVTIRHSFPPIWKSVESGAWVHIQPWEYGHLPSDWIAPLRDKVDEIWVPSNYVKRVYENSGISPGKIQVIPWGVDTHIYTPDAIPLLLPTTKSFRFLFVGGLIARKGFDRVLHAYLEEFDRNEDVTLVVKGTGEETFYRYGNCLSELKKAQSDRHAPEIVSVDRFLTDGQMPSLYTSCHCLIAPYRGEGFGLPILEAMACGLPAIVPIGGATDDFVTVKTGFLLNAEERESRHDWKLAGPCLELNVRTSEIRKTMREAFETRQRTREMGMRAAKYVSTHYPWARAISQMNCRIQYLATQKGNDKDKKLPNGNLGSNKKLMTIGIVVTAKVRQLPECLSRLQTLSEDIIVFDQTHDRRTPSIAHEYGVQIRPISRTTKLNEIRKMIKSVADSDWTVLFRPETQITPKVALDIRNYLNTLPAQRESAQYSIENRATGRAKTSRIRFERA